MYDEGAGVELAGNVAGNVRRLAGVESPQLGNTRDLFVYLPPSYQTSGRHYPVIYMHDGQNLFDAAMSFAGEWHVDDTMERLAGEGVEAIIVGIPNMGPARTDEYSPFRDPKAGGGKGDAYLSFVVDTVKPLVDARFRTAREPSHTGIMGSSMGGLISLYAVLRRPDVFGFAGVMSAAIWFAGGAIVEFARTQPPLRSRIYLDTGTGEGRAQVRQTRQLARELRARAVRPRLQLRYVEARDAGHNEAAWAARFERAVRWLLPKRIPELNW